MKIIIMQKIVLLFLSKAKRILKLAIQLNQNKDINKTINSAKPPIFWKEKEILRVQLEKWKPNKIEDLIKDLNDIELKIKQNYNYSTLIITNFILEQSLTKINN